MSDLYAGVNAQIVVDQSQLSDTVYMAGFSQTDLVSDHKRSLLQTKAYPRREISLRG